MSALALVLVWAGPFQPVSAGQSATEAPSPAGAEAIREELAAKLGVPKGDLRDDKDLVRDLKIDRDVVYYAVEELLAVRGIASDGRELTRVGDIISAVEGAKEGASVKTRGLSARASSKSYVQSVFYVTNRKPTGEKLPQGFFGADRSPNGMLHYGRAEVNIPRSHKLGQIERPWLRIGQLSDASKHIFTLSVTPADETGFFAALNGGAASKEDVLVYIHGFNMGFDDALLRTAQIAFDFGFTGTPIVFSWPSYRSIVAYNGDWENINWSTKHVENFLENLLAKTKGRKVHVIAHSLGATALLNALRLRAYRGKRGVMLQSVILCAPDFDAGLFREQIAAEVRPLARQWVVYSSKQDFTLIASRNFNTAPRLGIPITYAQGYEVIDASEVEVTPWSLPETHSYYATKKRVIDDMVKVIAGQGPLARGLSAKVSGKETVWVLR